MEEQKENDSNKEESSAVYSYIILGVISLLWWINTPNIVDAILKYIFAVEPNDLIMLFVLPLLLMLLSIVVLIVLYFGVGIGIDRMFKKSKSAKNTYYIVLTVSLVFTVILYVYYILEGLKSERY